MYIIKMSAINQRESMWRECSVGTHHTSSTDSAKNTERRWRPDGNDQKTSVPVNQNTHYQDVCYQSGRVDVAHTSLIGLAIVYKNVVGDLDSRHKEIASRQRSPTHVVTNAARLVDGRDG